MLVLIKEKPEYKTNLQKRWDKLVDEGASLSGTFEQYYKYIKVRPLPQYPGFFVTGNLNMEYELPDAVGIDVEAFTSCPYKMNETGKWSKWYDSTPRYGVCDHPSQVYEKYKWAFSDKDPRKWVVGFVPIVRKYEPEHGGWRWHKWGAYIGTKEPEHEYLYDDKHINMVWIYHAYLVKG